CRDYVVHGQVADDASLDLNALDVALEFDFLTGEHFLSCIHTVPFKKRQRFFLSVTLYGKRHRLDIRQSAFGSFLYPRRGVAISFEADVARLLDITAKNIDDCQSFFGTLLYAGGDFRIERLKLVGNNQVEGCHGRGAIVARSHGTELEFV